MRAARHTPLAIGVALVYFTLAGRCQNLPPKTELRLRLVQNTLVVVSLQVNGKSSFDFILDTGADTTIVDPSIAPELSLVSVDRVRQTTLSGVQVVTRSSMRHLSAGAVDVVDLPVLVEDLTMLRKMDAHIVGIAGQDFLSRFNYVLDYRKHVVRIEQGDEILDAIDGVHVPIEASGNRLLVACEAESRGRAKLQLMLDSGANSVVLLHEASRALDLTPREGGLERTTSGQVGMQVGRIGTLTVGSQQLHDLAAALPATDPREQIGDGLLPTSLFESVYFNNRQGFVVFNPRTKAKLHSQ
jgi:predicted aspartyl protease